MRRDSSPAAIAVAVSSIRDSGARLARISGNPMPASTRWPPPGHRVGEFQPADGALHVVETERGDDVAPAGDRRTSTRHEPPGYRRPR